MVVAADVSHWLRSASNVVWSSKMFARDVTHSVTQSAIAPYVAVADCSSVYHASTAAWTVSSVTVQAHAWLCVMPQLLAAQAAA